MRSDAIAIIGVGFQYPTQMHLAQDNDVGSRIHTRSIRSTVRQSRSARVRPSNDPPHIVLAEPNGFVVPDRVLQLGENVFVSERLAIGIDVGIPAGHVKERGHLLDVVRHDQSGDGSTWAIVNMHIATSGQSGQLLFFCPSDSTACRQTWRTYRSSRQRAAVLLQPASPTAQQQAQRSREPRADDR
jgi:hypothetical protein